MDDDQNFEAELLNLLREEHEKLDAEKVDLLRVERKKSPYIPESIDFERAEIAEHFFDHCTTVYALFDSELTFDALQNATVSHEQEEKIIEALTRAIQGEVERIPELCEGEMEVRGVGAYWYESEREDFEPAFEDLEESEILIGDIGGYYVAPSEENQGGSLPTIFVKLDNATVSDATGMEVKSVESVFVPFLEKRLMFSKVHRRNDEASLAPKEPERDKELEITTRFTGELIRDFCNDIENDLNHNEGWDEAEHFENRAEYQAQLDIFMEAVDKEAPLLLDLSSCISMNGEVIDFGTDVVKYLDSVIIEVSNTWRVVHGFITENDAKEITNIIHVLPEHIKKIEYLD